MKNKNLFFLFVVIAFSSCATDRPIPTWWKYQNNIRNWGQAQTNVPTGKPKFPVAFPGGAYVGCPVLWSDPNYDDLGDARVIVGDGGSGLTSLVPLNGNQDNHYSIGHVVSTCPAIPVNGEGPLGIYGSTTDGYVFRTTTALQQKWLKNFPETHGSVLVSSPVVWDNIVFVTIGKSFFALDAANGDPLWDHPINNGDDYAGKESAVIDPVDPATTFGYVATDKGEVVKFRVSRTDGYVWTSPSQGGRITGHLMIDGHHNIYVPMYDGSIRVLEPTAGNEIGRFESHEEGFTTGASLSFDGKTFYFANGAGVLFAVDIATRKRIWFHKLGLPPTTPIIVTPNETLWLGIGRGSEDASLVSYNAARDEVFPQSVILMISYDTWLSDPMARSSWLPVIPCILSNSALS